MYATRIRIRHWYVHFEPVISKYLSTMIQKSLTFWRQKKIPFSVILKTITWNKNLDSKAKRKFFTQKKIFVATGSYLSPWLSVITCHHKLRAVSFISAPSTAALSHRKPASTDISRDTCDAQHSYKRNTLYIHFLSCFLLINENTLNKAVLCKLGRIQI